MNLNFINLLFLIPLAIIGLICSYTDIKYNKIFNKWISLSFLYIFFLYVFLFFYFMTNEKENIYYILKLISNGLIAFLGGYLLWHFKLWSAGDAKLFTVYSFLIPLNFYRESYISYFPSFNLLINLFIPLLIILICSAFFTTAKRGYNLRYEIKEIKFPERKKLVKILATLLQIYLNYIFVFLLLQLLFLLIESLPLKQALLNPFFLFALLLLIMNRFNLIRKEKKWLEIIICGVIIGQVGFLILSGQFDSLKYVLKIALVFMVLIGFTHQILNYYIQKKEVRRIKIKDIKEGMILVKNEFSVIFSKFKDKAEKDKFEQIDAGGLKNNQVKIIKNLFKEDQEAEVGVYKTLPFAPFLFLSALISIFTQNSFLPLINNIFRYLIQ